MPIELAAGRADHPAARRRAAAEVERRLSDLLAALPDALPQIDATNPAALDEYLAQLGTSVLERMREHPASKSECVRYAEVLAGLAALRHDQAEQRARRRLLALAEVPELFAAAPGETDVGRILQRAAEHAARICELDRVMIFRLDQAQLIPEVTYFVGHADWAAQVLEHARPIELSAMRYEMEMIRRRAAALVTAPLQDPRVTGPTVAELGTDGFVSVPVVVGGTVVATLHGDTYFSGRRLDVTDRDALSVFGKGLGQALERGALLDRLAAQRDAVRRLARAAEATVEDLTTTDLGLAPPPVEAVVPDGAAQARPVRTGRLPARTPLTRREQDVLTLMARGATNREIAHRLVITEGTVKSHVKHVFRKLGVTNRAQAVVLHLGAGAAI
ncbi:MAG TPA: helix-turn-helix transcriptional regulator [Sporichthyaceae bacterium]